MDLELFRDIIQQVAPLTEQVCFHLMGDPLVHPKLEEFLQICSDANVKVFLVTNAVLLNEKNSQLLLHPALRQVNFSLHSFSDNYPGRDFNPYLRRVLDFTERAFLERPDLYINFRLWNLQETRGTNSNNQDMLDSISKHFQVDLRGEIDVRRNKSVNVRNRLYMHFDTEFVWPEMHLPVLGKSGTCLGLSQHFGILVDGTVVPCCLDKEGSIPLGKIQEQSVSEILNGNRAQAILKGFRERKLIENLCQRCQYIERFQTSASAD